MDGGRLSKRLKTSKDKILIENPDIVPVLADEYTAPVEFEDVYVADVVEKRETSRLLRELSLAFPLETLKHLKRVRAAEKPGGNLEIIVATLSSVSHLAHGAESVETKSLFGDGSCSVNLTGLGSVSRLAKVPLKAPLTRKQFKKAKAIWPCLFHEEKWIAAAENGTLWTANEFEFISACLLMSERYAKGAQSQDQRPVAALIVDPSTNLEIVSAIDLSSRNPLQHAVMVAIDLVALRQGGGAWGLTDLLYFGKSGKSIKKLKKDDSYLCSGYDLYTNKEPCAMCAMALVHSRIGRVFYTSESAEGALGSAYKIHTLKGLNHHFKVFKVTVKVVSPSQNPG